MAREKRQLCPGGVSASVAAEERSALLKSLGLHSSSHPGSHSSTDLLVYRFQLFPQKRIRRFCCLG